MSPPQTKFCKWKNYICFPLLLWERKQEQGCKWWCDPDPLLPYHLPSLYLSHWLPPPPVLHAVLLGGSWVLWLMLGPLLLSACMLGPVVFPGSTLILLSLLVQHERAARDPAQSQGLARQSAWSHRAAQDSVLIPLPDSGSPLGPVLLLVFLLSQGAVGESACSQRQQRTWSRFPWPFLAGCWLLLLPGSVLISSLLSDFLQVLHCLLAPCCTRDWQRHSCRARDLPFWGHPRQGLLRNRLFACLEKAPSSYHLIQVRPACLLLQPSVPDLGGPSLGQV